MTRLNSTAVRPRYDHSTTYVTTVDCVATASELILECGVEEARPKGPRVGMGFLGRGQPAPLHQLGGLRERCKLPQWGPGRSPGRRRVFLYSELSDCLSQHLSTCCIQFAWLGIRFF